MVGNHPPTSINRSLGLSPYREVEAKQGNFLVGYSRKQLTYLGKSGWLSRIIVFRFHFLKFQCIEPGLGFGLLTGYQGIRVTPASWPPCFITSMEWSAMRLGMSQALSHMTVCAQQGRGLLGNDEEEPLKEPS